MLSSNLFALELIRQRPYGQTSSHVSRSIRPYVIDPSTLSCYTYSVLYLIVISSLQYLGLHPDVFKDSANQAVGYVKQANELFSATTSFFRSRSSSGTQFTSPPPAAPKAIAALPPPPSPSNEGGWKKWAPAAYAVGGALLAVGAAGAAYYKRDEIGVGYKWAVDHMKYVGNLWDEAALKKRLEDLLQIEEKMGVMFRT